MIFWNNISKIKDKSKIKMTSNTKIVLEYPPPVVGAGVHTPIPKRNTFGILPPSYNFPTGFVYPTTNNLQVFPTQNKQTRLTQPPKNKQKVTQPPKNKQRKVTQPLKNKQIGFTTSSKQAELIQSNLQVLTCPKNDNINKFFTFEKQSFEYILLHKTHNISHIISSYEKCVLKQDIGPFLKSGDNIPYIWIDGTFQKMSLFTSDPRKNITPPLYCVALDINVSNRTDEFYGGQKCLFANIRPESQEIEATKEEEIVEDGSETEDEVEQNSQDEEKKAKRGRTGWIEYRCSNWSQIKQKNPEFTYNECLKYMGELWKSLSKEKKAEYNNKATLTNEKKRKEISQKNSSVAKKRRVSPN